MNPTTYAAMPEPGLLFETAASSIWTLIMTPHHQRVALVFPRYAFQDAQTRR